MAKRKLPVYLLLIVLLASFFVQFYKPIYATIGYFGYTGVGGSNNYDGTGYSHCCKFTAPENANVTRISVYMRGESGTINVIASIWDGAASGALLSSSSAVSVTTSVDWWNFTVFASVVSGQTYWLGVEASGNHRYYYTSGAANQWVAQWTISYPTVPNPWDSLSESYQAYQMSIYATYDNGAAPPAPPPLENVIYKININATQHNNYGLGYPATYVFEIPGSSAGLKAYKRYSTAESWSQLTEKNSSDFFNGIDCVRFDYGNNKTYVSVAFSASSDDIYIRLTDSSDNLIASKYSNIAEYYDNRKATVTSTNDDWDGNTVSLTAFAAAISAFQSRHIWFTGCIVTYGYPYAPPVPPVWATVQTQINNGYVEVASHSRTHETLPYSNYDSEIAGSKTDILGNLTLASPYTKGSTEYVWAWAEPWGTSDATVRQKLGQNYYLVARSYYDNQTVTWATWDSTNGLFNRVGITLEMGHLELNAISNVTILNSWFDTVYNAGGIYHLMTHPRDTNWTTGSYAHQHLDYIKEKLDVWYVGFGALYAYRYLATIANLTVQKVMFPYIQQQSDVDSSADIGTHSNFTAQQYGPDNINDTLTEASIAASSASFGNPETSGTSYTGAAANELFGGMWASGSTAASVYNITFFGSETGSGTRSVKGVICNSSGYILTNGVGSAVTVSGTTQAWYTSTFSTPPTIIGGTNYALLLVPDTAGFRLAYSSSSGGTQYADTSNSYASPTNPTDWVQTNATNYRVYANTSWTANYRLDIEEQFQDVENTTACTNKELCIATGQDDNTENLTVQAWNITSSAWVFLMNLTANSWNNVTIGGFSNATNVFTIRFIDGIQTGDTSPNSWIIDCVLMHLWNITAGTSALFFYSQLTLTMTLTRESLMAKGTETLLPLILVFSKGLSWSFNRYVTLPLTLYIQGIYSGILAGLIRFFYSVMTVQLIFNSLKTVTFTHGSSFSLALVLNGLSSFLRYRTFLGSLTLNFALNTLKTVTFRRASLLNLLASIFGNSGLAQPGIINLYGSIGLVLGFWTNGVPPTLANLVLTASENAQVAIGLALIAFCVAVAGLSFAIRRKRED
jgi:hypothetical protein